MGDVGEKDLYERLSRMHDDLERHTKEKDQEREKRKKKEDELAVAKQAVLEKTKLLDQTNDEIALLKAHQSTALQKEGPAPEELLKEVSSLKEELSKIRSDHITSEKAASKEIAKELCQLKDDVSNLKTERDQVIQERETTFKELTEELEGYVKREQSLESTLEKMKSEDKAVCKKLEVTANELKILKVNLEEGSKRLEESEKYRQELLKKTEQLQSEGTDATTSHQSSKKE